VETRELLTALDLPKGLYIYDMLYEIHVEHVIILTEVIYCTFRNAIRRIFIILN
jgi:hypothetical protein